MKAKKIYQTFIRNAGNIALTVVLASVSSSLLAQNQDGELTDAQRKSVSWDELRNFTDYKALSARQKAKICGMYQVTRSGVALSLYMVLFDKGLQQTLSAEQQKVIYDVKVDLFKNRIVISSFSYKEYLLKEQEYMLTYQLFSDVLSYNSDKYISFEEHNVDMIKFLEAMNELTHAQSAELTMVCRAHLTFELEQGAKTIDQKLFKKIKDTAREIGQENLKGIDRSIWTSEIGNKSADEHRREIINGINFLSLHKLID